MELSPTVLDVVSTETEAYDARLQFSPETVRRFGHPNEEKEREFTVLRTPRKGNVRVAALTKDRLWGAVETFSAEQCREFQTIPLKTTATVRVQVLDKATGKPVAKKFVSVSMGIHSQDGKTTHWADNRRIIPPAVTSENGTVTFCLPPGTCDYRFNIGSDLRIEKSQWTLKPNESVDLVGEI